MKGIATIAPALLVTMTATAQAQDTLIPSPVLETAKAAATGNLPPGFYPKSPCIKPDSQSIARPPLDRRDLRTVYAFNEKVRSYNKVTQTYNACVLDYVARAQRDIQEIQAAIAAVNAN